MLSRHGPRFESRSDNSSGSVIPSSPTIQGSGSLSELCFQSSSSRLCILFTLRVVNPIHEEKGHHGIETRQVVEQLRRLVTSASTSTRTNTGISTNFSTATAPSAASGSKIGYGWRVSWRRAGNIKIPVIRPVRHGCCCAGAGQGDFHQHRSSDGELKDSEAVTFGLVCC